MSSVWRQTLAAVECGSLAKRTVVHTLTDQSLTYTHTRGQCVCCSGRGDTCVTVKRQNICLGNLDVSGCTHTLTHGLIYPQLSVWGFLTTFSWKTERTEPETGLLLCMCVWGKSILFILQQLSYNNGFTTIISIVHVSLSLSSKVRVQVVTKDSKDLKWWNLSSSKYSQSSQTGLISLASLWMLAFD